MLKLKLDSTFPSATYAVTMQRSTCPPHFRLTWLNMGFYINPRALLFETKVPKDFLADVVSTTWLLLIACRLQCLIVISPNVLFSAKSLFHVPIRVFGVLAMFEMFGRLLLNWIQKHWNVSFWGTLNYIRDIVATLLIFENTLCLLMWCSQNMSHSSPCHPLHHLRGWKMND